MLYKQLIVVMVALALGAVIGWEPEKSIKVQAHFYKTGNWKLEPVSMKKEIKRMRVLGRLIFILGIVSFIAVLHSL